MSRMGDEEAKHAEKRRQMTRVRIAKCATQKHHQLLKPTRTSPTTKVRKEYHREERLQRRQKLFLKER